MKLKIIKHIEIESSVKKVFDKQHWLIDEINQNFGLKITSGTKSYYFNYMLIFRR